MKLTIAVLPGDGIGPEVTSQAVKALEAISFSFDHIFTFKTGLIGSTAIKKTGNPLPKDTLHTCFESDAILLGMINDPKFDSKAQTSVAPIEGLLKLRKELGLYANIRNITAYDTLLDRSPLKPEIIEGTDIAIYRELTGGIYFGKKEIRNGGTIASDLCEYTQDEIERISHLAFNAAKKRRNKVTLIDKANVLESSRLWRKVVTKVSSEYPDVVLNFLFVDDAAMQMILNPGQFDVILTENMFGDIISDEASVIGGTVGLLASASIGLHNCLFQPVRSSGLRSIKRGIANPLASILAAAMLLEHFNLVGEATAIRDAVEKALELNLTTPDLNPINPLTTEKVGDFIYDYILNPEDSNMNFENIHVGQSTII